MNVKIHFTRDSVYMVDDCLDNSRDYEFQKKNHGKKLCITL